MKIILILLVIYLSICGYMYVTQDSKIFNKKYALPYNPKFAKKIYFITSDGFKLEGAFTKNGEKLPLILYFSGNANNVIEFLDNIAPKIKGYNFIGFNYPGYANSKGTPCEKCILKYAIEIFDKYKPEYIIGRSLGSAVATFVASKRDIKKLILITPFDSIENIAKTKYPFLPIKYLLKYKFKEYKWIRNVKSPVSILLVKNDDVIPQESINNLLQNIPNLSKKVEIESVKHGDIYEYKNINKIIKQLF